MWDNPNHFQSVFDRHNEQHLQSVNVARDELQKKLSKIEGKSGIYNGNQAAMYENSYSAGGSERLSSGHSGLGICSYCTTSDSLSSYNSRYDFIFSTFLELSMNFFSLLITSIVNKLNMTTTSKCLINSSFK